MEVDCWNHLRNICLGGITKALSRYLRDVLTNDLEHIIPRRRVIPCIEAFLRAVDR